MNRQKGCHQKMKHSQTQGLVPTHEGCHASHCLSIAGLLREILICRFVPGEFSGWGDVPVVSFQQGTGLTVLFIFTFRPTGTLDSSRTGQGLVHTEGGITGTGRQYIRTCTWSLNRLGGRPAPGASTGWVAFCCLSSLLGGTASLVA